MLWFQTTMCLYSLKCCHHNTSLPCSSGRWEVFLFFFLRFKSFEMHVVLNEKSEYEAVVCIHVVPGRFYSSVKLSYLQWTTAICDLLCFISFIMSVRSWAFSGTSLFPHFRNWNCFTERLSFLCWQKSCWVKAACDVVMTGHVTTGVDADKMWKQNRCLLCYLDMTD